MHKTWRLRVKSVRPQMKSPKCVQLFTGPVKFQFVCLLLSFIFFAGITKSGGRKQRDERAKTCRTEREVTGVKTLQKETCWSGVQCSDQVFVTCSCGTSGLNLWDASILTLFLGFL